MIRWIDDLRARRAGRHSLRLRAELARVTTPRSAFEIARLARVPISHGETMLGLWALAGLLNRTWRGHAESGRTPLFSLSTSGEAWAAGLPRQQDTTPPEVREAS